MENIAVFASGNGTNAENICNYFSGSKKVRVSLICTNKKDALVLKKTKRFGVDQLVFSKKEMDEGGVLESVLKEKNIHFIVLAGFLLKVPRKIISLFNKKIINIHPSLLPKYGGKGMFGNNVHRLVIKNKEVESGITIHFVNDEYDQGGIIFQEKVVLSSEETPKSLAQKIHLLEKKFVPKTIEKTILK